MKPCLFSLVMKDDPIEEVIRSAAEVGYEAVEIRGAAPHLTPQTTDDEARRIREIAENYGIKIAAIGTYTGRYGIKNEKECEETFNHFKRFVELADILGAEVIRHGPGGPPPYLSKPYHWLKEAEWMKRACEFAENYGKKVAMEIHHNGLIEDATCALIFLSMVEMPNLGVLYDPGNMFLAAVDYEWKSIHSLRGKIFHVHIKDEAYVDAGITTTVRIGEISFKGTLLGEGMVNYREVLKELRNIGYDGYLSIETHTKEYDSRYIIEHDFMVLNSWLQEI
ncbi:hypothetical protein DRN93_05080 [archaeon]|nr:MAG: hypothetical protein DRN93_05080 [archaeon]